jgi:signal peptidase I
MFFFQPRYVKQGQQFVKDARKLLAYKRDLWSEATIVDIEKTIEKLEKGIADRDERVVNEAAQQLDVLVGQHAPPAKDAWMRENVEVFLVAIAVAVGVRTYFLQPFTIPTGSMQPTLNGIIGFPTTEPPPNPVAQIFDLVLFGRGWVNIQAKDDESIVSVTEQNRFRFFTYTRIETDKHNVYWVHAAKETVDRYRLMASGREEKGGAFNRGDVIARGHIDSGDMVFVDKFSYNFRKPRRDEVFVFNTQHIPTRDNQHQGMNGPSQFYIKRLAGTPNDTLQIRPPELFLNGERAKGRGFDRVMSGALQAPNHDYLGYSNASLQPASKEIAEMQLVREREQPDSARTNIVKLKDAYFYLYPMNYLGDPSSHVTLGPKEYYALGDNSYHSSDSRDWGPVPQQNIMGRGMFVYWPFTRHWGPIR